MCWNSGVRLALEIVGSMMNTRKKSGLRREQMMYQGGPLRQKLAMANG